MSFQLGSTEKPNSVENTCIFSIFNASDTPTNLHIALARYKDQISDLAKLQWRYGCTDGCTCTNSYALHASAQGKEHQDLFVWRLRSARQHVRGMSRVSCSSDSYMYPFNIAFRSPLLFVV